MHKRLIRLRSIEHSVHRGRCPMSWQRRVRRIARLGSRFPWLLPLTSFLAGWIGFVMVQRGANAARLIALLALLGWPWLLIEPVVRRALEKRKPRLGNFVVNFVSQSLQQELLFFSLPLLIGATQLDAGQIAFTGLAASAALVSTIDPMYERYVATRAAAAPPVPRVLQLARGARGAADGPPAAARACVAGLARRSSGVARAHAAAVVVFAEEPQAQARVGARRARRPAAALGRARAGTGRGARRDRGAHHAVDRGARRPACRCARSRAAISSAA